MIFTTKSSSLERTAEPSVIDTYKMSYYPPFRSSSNNIKVELDLRNYATKDYVKKVEDKVNENKK